MSSTIILYPALFKKGFKKALKNESNEGKKQIKTYWKMRES